MELGILFFNIRWERELDVLLWAFLQKTVGGVVFVFPILPFPQLKYRTYYPEMNTAV